MEQKNTKKEIIALCDDFITFWKQFKEEIDSISDENDVELVCKWNDFFTTHNDTIVNLIGVKLDVEIIEKALIEKGILKDGECE